MADLSSKLDGLKDGDIVRLDGKLYEKRGNTLVKIDEKRADTLVQVPVGEKNRHHETPKLKPTEHLLPTDAITQPGPEFGLKEGPGEYEIAGPYSTRKSRETLYEGRDANIPTSAAPARQERHAKDSKRKDDRAQQRQSNELLSQKPQVERRPTGTIDTPNLIPTHRPPPRTTPSDQHRGEKSQSYLPPSFGTHPSALAPEQRDNDEEDLRSQPQYGNQKDFGPLPQWNDEKDSRLQRQRDDNENLGFRHRRNDKEDSELRRERNDEEVHRNRRPRDVEEVPTSRRRGDDEKEEQSRPRYPRRGTTTSQKNPQVSSRDQLSNEHETAVEDEDVIEGEPLFKALTGVATHFVNISHNDFIERADFVIENDEIMNTKFGRFLEEAIWQKVHGRLEMAAKCIQSLVLLNTWKDMKPRDLYKHADRLMDQNNRERDAYHKLYAQVEQTVDKQANEIVQRASAPQLSASAPRHSKTSQPNPEANLPIRTQNTTNPQSTSLPVEIQENERTRKVMDRISRIATKSPPPIPSIPPEKFAGEDAKALKALSSLYQVPKNGKNFFRTGRVFSILWSQPAGQTHRSRPSNPIDEPTPTEKLPYNVTYGLHGERIFSQIRRMIVIRNREGYCWCVSIGTYGGRGLKKSGLKQSEIDAHAVVYDSKAEPDYLEGEPKTSKRAIAVDLENGQSLSNSSRLHFAKPFTIEWNTKVMNVGMVANECLISLVADVAEELLGDLKQRQNA